MPSNQGIVSREVIKPQVVKALSKASGKKNLAESYRLEQDLGLNKDARSALKKPLNDISHDKYEGYIIFSTECVKLERVENAIDLVHRKANRSEE